MDGGGYFYDFARGALTTPGLHSTTIPGNSGTLKVEVTDDLAVANAASFDYCGPVDSTICPWLGISPGSIASVFGSNNISNTTSVASGGGSLPTILAGTSVEIRDSAGSEQLAPLYFVAPTQINFLVPPQTALGPATLTVRTTTGPRQIVTTILPFRPGIFSANANGGPVPAAQLIRTKPDGSQSLENTFQWNSAAALWELRLIDPGPDTLHVVVYGTGIRNGKDVRVHCWCGSSSDTAFPVTYAGTQPEYPGLDQVNFQIPKVRGTGTSELLWLTVDGLASNQFRLEVVQ